MSLSEVGTALRFPSSREHLRAAGMGVSGLRGSKQTVCVVAGTNSPRLASRASDSGCPTFRMTGVGSTLLGGREAAAASRTKSQPAAMNEAQHDGHYPDRAAGERAARARACGAAHRGPAAGHRPRALCRRHQLSASAAHAHRALAEGARADHRRSTPRRLWRCRASYAVWTNADIAELSPIDFRADKIGRGHSRISPAGAGEDLRALRRRSGGGGVRRRPLRRRGRRRAGDDRARRPARRALGQRSARRVRARPQHRGHHPASQLRRHRSRVPQRARGDRDRRCKPAATPACRSRPAAPSAATTRRRTCSSCTAPPRSRIAIARRSAACSTAARRRCMCMRAMSAAASAFAASFIPRTCWCWSRRCASSGR